MIVWAVFILVCIQTELSIFPKQEEPCQQDHFPINLKAYKNQFSEYSRGEISNQIDPSKLRDLND